MKRVKAACICQTLHFMLKDDLGHDYAVKLVKESPGKVYLELTAIPGVNGVIEQLVENAGSESLLLGSDLPWFDEFQVIGGVLSSKISDEDKRNIFYRNVEKLFGKNW